MAVESRVRAEREHEQPDGDESIESEFGTAPPESPDAGADDERRREKIERHAQRLVSPSYRHERAVADADTPAAKQQRRRSYRADHRSRNCERTSSGSQPRRL